MKETFRDKYGLVYYAKKNNYLLCTSQSGTLDKCIKEED